MAANRTVEEKVGDWLAAYNAIREEITPKEFRPLMALMGTADGMAGDVNIQAINVGVSVSRIVMANDRAAATVAALLTTNGVKPSGLEYTGEYPE
jgi:hypothetical protein